ncbi:dihydrofolate reductase [Acetitomaculum ruminis DSM 5522]|uniref:Dihydrofolate reductase n=1 Tax=Acetitomaculum ruminis DSM 5522 TaxID=1120918 RepID=A0A1I0VSW1_9FIRM|nr:dihydrofolate reductase [Acetitomaculum ruminis]SFA79053.1 dihydrofolate reductase [Acetitomaculum ruminis DSM 5522]
MKLIVAADKNWGIGKNNELLVSIPEDMRFFKKMTTGNVVVLGRKTLESFKNSKPLPDRTNIILTTRQDYKVEGAIVVHSIDELMETLKEYDSDNVYVIGGAKVYDQLIDKCDTAYVTKIDKEFDADRYFPNLDKDTSWTLESESEEGTYFSIVYTFRKYVKRNG